MLAQLQILARDDEGSGITLKIIIGLVFAGFWVISQIVSALGKKKDKLPQGDYPVVLPPEAPVPQRPAPQRPVPQRPVPQQTAPRPVPQRPVQAPQHAPRTQTPVKHRRETHQQTARQAPPAPPARRDLPPPRQPERMASSSPSVPAAPAVTSRQEARNAQVAGTVTSTQRGASSEGPNATQRLRALLRPGNLRKEFVMTEILQPPLATRPRREIG